MIIYGCKEGDYMMKMILFDLDGTLLPMDQEAFTKAYFKLLAANFASYGFEAKPLIDTIWAGTAAMVKNDGSRNNEAVFWEMFEKTFGTEKTLLAKTHFNDFYTKDFNEAKSCCGYNPKAIQAVKKAKQLGYRVVLATNPIFPKVATENRTRWAGLSFDDFELCTTYENTCYCKPNPEYYRDIAKRFAVNEEDCLMIGNDVSEDMIAASIGMKTFLLTNCLINTEQRDISAYPNGDFDQLIHYLEHI